MPLDRLVLILVIVVLAMIATAWLTALVLAAYAVPAAWIALIPAAIVGYIVWRVIADRISNREDDHYDRIKK